MILYFTGTGNSEFCAKYIGSRLGDECLNLFQKIRDKDVRAIESKTPFVVVCPTYAWRIPEVLNNFLSKTPLNLNKDIYFVMTCGGEIGNARKYIKKLCDEKGMNLKGVFSVKMPDNYIAMFNTEPLKVNKKIIKEALPVLDGISATIKNGVDGNPPKVSFQDKALSGFINTAFYSLFVKDKAFKVSDECIGCGLCEKNCPTGNIVMKNNKPTWNGNCTHCMACISHCPKTAIEYGKKTEGKIRYIFPKNSFKTD